MSIYEPTGNKANNNMPREENLRVLAKARAKSAEVRKARGVRTVAERLAATQAKAAKLAEQQANIERKKALAEQRARERAEKALAKLVKKNGRADDPVVQAIRSVPMPDSSGVLAKIAALEAAVSGIEKRLARLESELGVQP